jgi:hypothetical protein
LDLLRREVPATSLVVAIDPGKAFNRVWLTTGERGLIGEPVTLPVLREGVDALERLIDASGVDGRPVIGLEATGALHRAWAAEIERRWPGSLRLFAPSETTAARGQLGSRRFKSDDRDCAAMIWLLRQGAGRPAEPDLVAALLGGARHRGRWSTPAACCSSVCMISSTRYAPDCQRRRATAASSSCPHRPARRSWPARRRSPDVHPPSARCWRARRAG